MGLVEAAVTIIVAVLGAGGVITIYIKHRLDKESDRGQKICDVNDEIDFAKMEEWEALAKLLNEIVACLHGEKANGNLQAALNRFLKAVQDLKRLYDKKRILLERKDA